MRTKLSIAAVALAAAALIGGAAWACVPGASITLTPGTGGPGTAVGVSGTTFDAQGSLVNIYWDGTGGTLLAQVPVQPDRTFSYSFIVPANATSGSHVVSATQLDRNGLAYNPVNRAFSIPGTRAPNRSVVQGPAQPPADGLTQPAPAAQPARTAVQAPAPAPAAPGPGPGPGPAAGQAQPGTPGSPGVGAASPQAPPATPSADAQQAAQQPAGSQEAFRTPVPAPAPAGATEAVASSGGAPAWLLIPLAVLSLGFLGTGAGIFARERKRVRVQA
jgi:hypothetical protein